jgi:tetratricopeptide (TPR) repeat protein
MELEDSQEILDEIAVLVTDLRAIPPTTVLVELLRVLSFDLSDKDLAASTALDREAVAAARAIGDPETIASALLNAHWAWWVNGDIDTQHRALLETLQHIESTGAERHLSSVLGWLGASAAVRGAFGEAIEYSARANERAAVSGSSLQRAITLLGATWTALWRGDLRAAVEGAQRGVDAAIDAGERATIGTNYQFLGDALDAAGKLGQAREAQETAIAHLSGPPSKGLRAETRTHLVKTLVGLGDLVEARHQAELARAEVAANDVYTLATAAAALAAVCAAERKPEEAERLFREAIERIAPTGYATRHIDIRREYAAFLIACGRGDEARTILEQVRSFYDTPATPFELQRTDALLERCAAVPR